MAAVVDKEGKLNKNRSLEIPMDGENLSRTSVTFRRACLAFGGIPVPMFQPVLCQVLDCLMGMTSFHSLDKTSLMMLFFTAEFLESEVIYNFVCFDLLDKNSCVDILQYVLMLKGKEHFLTKAVLNFFRGAFKMDPAYVLLVVEANARRVRWEVSKFNGENHGLSRVAHFPAVCKFCTKTITRPKHQNPFKKVAYMTCCLQSCHIGCLKRMYGEKFGHCASCNFPYLSGTLESAGELGQVLSVSLIRTVGAPPEAKRVEGEVFKFIQSPYGCRESPSVVEVADSVC